MKMYRICAVIKRHLFQMYKDVSRLLDLFYWPAFDIILWGFTTIWLVTGSESTSTLGFALLSCLTLWSIPWRSSVDISISLLDEIWSKNIVNLFSSPLQLSEWATGMMILGFFRALTVFFYSAGIVWLLFHWNIFNLGLPLIAYILLTMISGWAIGFLVAGLLIYYGQRMQGFLWAIGWMFSILGAVFFPISIFPLWLQIICKSFPLAYVFEAIRTQVETGVVAWVYLVIALLLNLIYLSLSFLFFKYMFNRSRTRGLSHLEIN